MTQITNNFFYFLFADDVAGMADKFNNDNIKDKVKHHVCCIVEILHSTKLVLTVTSSSRSLGRGL